MRSRGATACTQAVFPTGGARHCLSTSSGTNEVSIDLCLLIRRDEEPRQRYLKPGQQGGLIRVSFGNDLLFLTCRSVANHRQSPPKAINNPILRDARFLVVSALVHVIAPAVAGAG